MPEKFYITTPIYYVNDVPHIGHSYTEIACDVLARWKRMQGYDVCFLTGTDEHGQKIAVSASEAGRQPKEHVDINMQRFKDAWNKLDIRYDRFIRTTDEVHIKTVQYIFGRLYEKGDIYKGTYEGWYCAPCESYWTAFQLQGKDECPDCKRQVAKITEEAYFFALSKYQDRILGHIKNNPDFIQPVSRRNEIIKFIESGLKDQNVSRTNFSWGVPVPFDEKHVVYVWFDALINYISAIGYPDDAGSFGKWWPADVHMMGKEIVRFHAVIWPIMLMALDLPLPKKVFGHGWWTVEGEKMSKSKGNVVDPVKLADESGLDVVRYFLMREVPFGSDGDFSREMLIKRYNADLANDLGNLLSRSLTMISKYFEGKVPAKGAGAEDALDKEMSSLISGTPARFAAAMDELAVTEALNAVWALVSFSNSYIENKAPWKLAKEGRTDELSTVMANLFEALRVVSILITPFMPSTAEAMRGQMGLGPAESGDDAALLGHVPCAGTTVNKGLPLFPRIQDNA